MAQAYGVSGAGPVTLGATGAASGDGRDVNVITQQTVSTSGAYAHGIVAQSIGGGGGLLQAFDANGNALRLQLQGGAGGGGNGGNVSVTSNAAISTTGAGAHGIVAQSVAGGGGIVGGGVFATSLPITTTGFAGSAGGAGTAGTVTVNSQANITTMGLNSTAVFAESIDRFGLGGVIGVTLGNAATGTALTTLGGGGLGNGVAFVGGSSNAASPNTLINYTTLTTTSLINGMTITGAFGSEDVSNYGHLIGSVNLVGGPSQLPLPDHPGEVNTIENMPFHSNPSLFSGVFDSGPSIILSNNVAPPAADIFTNGGLISPGALLNVFTTNVAGNFVQTVESGGLWLLRQSDNDVWLLRRRLRHEASGHGPSECEWNGDSLRRGRRERHEPGLCASRSLEQNHRPHSGRRDASQSDPASAAFGGRGLFPRLHAFRHHAEHDGQLRACRPHA